MRNRSRKPCSTGVATTRPNGGPMHPKRYNPGVTSLPIRSCPDRRNRTCIGHIGSTLSVLTILLGSAILPAFRDGAVFGQPLNSSKGDLALVRATIYVGPTEEPIRDGVVLIRGGKIAAVGSGASLLVPQTVQSLDCSGRTITAGFWNSHVHFF